jgi:hypothetical protein
VREEYPCECCLQAVGGYSVWKGNALLKYLPSLVHGRRVFQKDHRPGTASHAMTAAVTHTYSFSGLNRPQLDGLGQ